jgi:hypothetical protein
MATAKAKSQRLFEMPASKVNLQSEAEVAQLVTRVNTTSLEPTSEARNIPKTLPVADTEVRGKASR